MPQPLLALRTFRSESRRSDVENFRDRRIRELVAHAYENVPFYRKLYDAHGVAPDKVRGFGDLPMLPLVTKNDFQRADESDLIARGVDSRKLHVRLTTGTTGEPLFVKRTKAESTLLRLYRFQAFRTLGVRRTDLSVGIFLPRADSSVPTSTPTRRIANRIGFYPRTMLCADDLLKLLQSLKRLAPPILGGVPSVLSEIVARWPPQACDEIRSASWPRLLVTGGERLFPSVATYLGEFFGTRVVDMYASEEFNLIASQCLTTGEYHVCDETVALEVIDDEMIGTALHSFAAPIIRYRSGDLVTSGATQCACGVSLSTISEIQGRVIHYLRFPDGTIIHHNRVEQAVAYAANWVRQTQVSQLTVDHVIVRVAPLRDVSAEEIERVRSSVRKALYNLMSVEIVIDRDLGPDHRGKSVPMIPLPKKTAAPDVDAAGLN